MQITLRFLVVFVLSFGSLWAQSSMVTYAGAGGKETFYDVMQVTDGSFLVCGYTESLGWIPSGTPVTELTVTSTIPNALGTNRYGIILQLSADMQQILQVVHFPQGAVEDVRFMKTSTLPYLPTGDLFVSCNTEDTYANDGGYIITKLNNNFVNGVPTSTSWIRVVWAKSYAKESHPWDVTFDGEVYYVSGEAHGYDWSAMYKLNTSGQRMVVNNWRTHWLKTGSEWKGTPASANPLGSVDSVNYSGIVFKIGGRCELRSWNSTDFNSIYPDGNGGTKKGKWPADFLFNGPCDPAAPTANGPGYNGYSAESCCPVWGASAVVVDRRNGHMYLGMNFKSYSNTVGSPDFEPAVIAFDASGQMLWWSRLYHEITPTGDTIESIPDQYVDALAIDYTHNTLVVAARAHGNNTENLWEGNTIAVNPSAYGFQNRFTGTNGNIHESWLGKLQLSDGTLVSSTYVAELAEGTGGLGTPHADPNLDGWPDPNTGWPDVNTTRIAKNNIKITADGNVCIPAVGRRTVTTSNAWQKMVKPFYGGASCWNGFVRVYDSQLRVPLYSSLVVGVWDTITQVGGGNTELYGVYKTSQGVVAVGRHTADAGGTPNGNPIPVANVPAWGNSSPQNESAVLVYFKAPELVSAGDSIQMTGMETSYKEDVLVLAPNPADKTLMLYYLDEWTNDDSQKFYTITDTQGRIVVQQALTGDKMDVSFLPDGLYYVKVYTSGISTIKKILVIHS